MTTKFFLLFAFLELAFSQQIYDIFTTTWDRSSLFTYTNLHPNPINFASPGTIGSADIIVNDQTTYQTIDGFGASLSDSSAQLLSNLKGTNLASYWSLIGYAFDPADGRQSAGLSYLRVPLGASDFSANGYSYDDTSGDTLFRQFNIHAAPSYVFSTIKDIMAMNPILKVHIVPWSPPGWMKTTGTMNGGSLKNRYIGIYANYLLKCVQGFANEGIIPHAISIQNEPQHSDSTYPTCFLSVTQEAQIGFALRTLLDEMGFSDVRIVGYEHNWDDAAAYPVQLMQRAYSAFDGIAFHCYAGRANNQVQFYNQYPQKSIWFTECTGTLGSDWWSDIKWYMDNLMIGALSYYSRSALMWNLALDASGKPILPGTNSCGNGCRGVVQVNNDGTWIVNQEFYSMAQASRAVVPKDSGGPWGERIGVSVGGSMNWALVVGAYATRRTNPSDWDRYSLVVLNRADNTDGVWNPRAVSTTIEFRGLQAQYTFPVGVTTLWWYAKPTASVSPIPANVTVHAETQWTAQTIRPKGRLPKFFSNMGDGIFRTAHSSLSHIKYGK